MVKRIVVLFSLIALIALAIFFAINAYQKISYPLIYQEEILFASKEYDIEPYVIASMINVESSFSKDALSSKGAVGLMQLLPSTASWLAAKVGLTNYQDSMLSEPNVNIVLGTYYLKYLFSRFDDEIAAFCAYNAGEGIVNGWLSNSLYSSDGKVLKQIPYVETQNYISKLLKNLKIYINMF